MRILAASLLFFVSGPVSAAGFAPAEDLFGVDFAVLKDQAARTPDPKAGPAGGAQAQRPVRSLSGLFRSQQVETGYLPDSFRRRRRAGCNLNAAVDDYRIGDEFGKKPVTAGGLGGTSPVFQRAAKATAAYGGGTAFYLGKFNGHHMVATNHHVAEGGCQGPARFPLLGKSYSCERVYADWKEVDLDLFSIIVPEADEALLAPLGRNFSFDASIYTGQELLTVGFGIAGNPRRVMMANQDSDCKVFSDTGDFRLVADPDQYNPADYSAWSFVNGCDVSHGDSGSAFVDRNTGDVLGLIWTGKIPKSPKVLSSAYLAEMLRTKSPEIWTELAFCVPAPKIKERIQEELQASPGNNDRNRTLTAIVQTPVTLSAR